jgi:hypothetical protein
LKRIDINEKMYSQNLLEIVYFKINKPFKKPIKMKSILRISLILIVFLISASTADAQKSKDKKQTINVLENGLDMFSSTHGSWIFVDDQLHLPVKNEMKNRKDIFLKDDFTDFVIELDFKVDSGTNSGVFFRVGNTKDASQTGLEIQTRDDYGKSPIDSKICGSLYDTKAVSVNTVKKVGKWNHLKITAKGPSVKVDLNKKTVVDVNLDEWTTAEKNPDGTPNKFKIAVKDKPRSGKIGFQDHGGIVWYKNVKITKL